MEFDAVRCLGMLLNPAHLVCKLSEGLAFYRIKEFQTIEGFLTTKEALALYRLSRKLRLSSTIVEIGSWKGWSTYCLAKGVRKGLVFAIDPFDASGDQDSAKIYETQRGAAPLSEQFRQTMAKFGVLKKVRPLRGFSADYSNLFSRIDCLFIDGNHDKEACDQDFRLYASKITVGGYVALHDYDPARQDLGPTWVINNRILLSPVYKFVELVDSLWVARKVR